MEIECFHNVIASLLLVSAMYEAKRPELAEKFRRWSLDYDSYYENMYEAISEVFLGFKAYIIEEDDTELMVFSDPVITDFFVTAAKYGASLGLSDDDNPYIKAVYARSNELFNFSYSLGWSIRWRGLELSPRTRFTVEIYVSDFDGYEDLAHALVLFYSWFSEKLEELRKIQEVTAA